MEDEFCNLQIHECLGTTPTISFEEDTYQESSSSVDVSKDSSSSSSTSSSTSDFHTAELLASSNDKSVITSSADDCIDTSSVSTTEIAAEGNIMDTSSSSSTSSSTSDRDTTVLLSLSMDIHVITSSANDCIGTSSSSVQENLEENTHNYEGGNAMTETSTPHLAATLLNSHFSNVGILEERNLDDLEASQELDVEVAYHDFAALVNFRYVYDEMAVATGSRPSIIDFSLANGNMKRVKTNPGGVYKPSEGIVMLSINGTTLEPHGRMNWNDLSSELKDKYRKEFKEWEDNTTKLEILAQAKKRKTLANEETNNKRQKRQQKKKVVADSVSTSEEVKIDDERPT